MAGPDPIEAAGWQLRLRAPRHKRLRDFKVALMLDTPDIAVDREVQDRLRALADFLRRQKVKVDETARPAIDPREAFRVYTRLLRSATSDRQTDADFETNSGIARALPPGDESYCARAMRAAVHVPPRLARRQRDAAPHAACSGRSSSPSTTCCSAPSPPPRPSRTIRRGTASIAR